MDAGHFDLAHRGGSRKRAAPAQLEATGTLFDFVPRAAADPEFEQLVAIVDELEHLHTKKHGPEYGVTVGEVVFEAEQNRGIKVGGVPMEDPILQQRQTSWLPRIMPAAGLVATDRLRVSPLKRHHRKRQTVWIRREVKP
jgi:hypothetical protein